MAYDEPWKLSEDGYLNVDVESKSIIYHPNLNIIFVCTKSSDVLVVDVNSGVILQKSSLLGNHGGKLNGAYFVGYDKVLFTDGRGIGVRRDYNGVMLLDTILQTPVSKPDDLVRLELLLSEAILLQQSLRCVELPGVDHTPEVLQELTTKIKEGQEKPKKGTKAQKWNSICLEVPHVALRLVCSGLVTELKRQNRHIPALSIASAINERLGCLLTATSVEVLPADRSLMFSEAARMDTFFKWPHMNYKWALPDHMAQAGFYHQPNSIGDDRAMCFTCNVCLVCWEPTDEPWSEHERHSPSCPFVKGEYTQNVPLSVTYATSPAVLLGEQGEEVDCIGPSSQPELVATATNHGLIVIWNISRQLKKEVCFYVAPSEITRPEEELKPRDLWAWTERMTSSQSPTSGQDIVEIPLMDSTVENLLGPPSGSQEVELSAVSILGCASKKSVRPCVISGVGVRPSSLLSNKSNLESVWGGGCSQMVQAMNSANEAQTAALDMLQGRQNLDKSGCGSFNHSKSLYLVVYDFHYTSPTTKSGKDGGGGVGSKSGQGGNPKKLISGTGTSASNSGTRQENNNMYQEIFLSKFLYDVPVMEDEDTNIVVTAHPDCVDAMEFPGSSAAGGFLPPPGIAGIQGGGTYDASAVKLSFAAALNGNANIGSNFPSTSEGSPPLLIKVSRNNKKDSSSNNSSSVDSSNNIRQVKRVDPIAIQCIALPDMYKDRRDLVVLSIHPTKDGGHMLVVLGPPDCDNMLNLCKSNSKPTNSYEEFFDESENMDVDLDVESVEHVPQTTSSTIPYQDYVNLRTNYGFFNKGAMFEDNYPLPSSGIKDKAPAGIGVILLYSLNFEGEVVKVNEVPVSVLEVSADECPKEVILLPLREKEGLEGKDVQPSVLGPESRAAYVCCDGSLRILDLSTMKVCSTAKPGASGVMFVSAAYCNSLERLCACTNKGTLHFFVLDDDSTIEELEEESLTHGNEWSQLNCHQQHVASPSVSCVGDRSFSPPPLHSPTGSCTPGECHLLVNRTSLGLSELRSLHELTCHENLSPLFSATVPPCWTEMMQAQKQRRHPQHLQQGEDLQHTRTWRLQNDATTWDEHVFELTLPRSCCIGHVDVKFSLHSPCPTPPNVQVTLLKQNAHGIGRKEMPSFSPTQSVDQPVQFNLTNNYSGNMEVLGENPVTSEEYLRDHNTEILCGPVNLSTCLDLSDQGGSVTLTSPKLFTIRGRTLLVHIKALGDDKVEQSTSSKARGHADDKGSASKKSKLDNSSSVPTLDRLCPPNNKKLDYYLGCDWLHEVSITVRKTKQTNVPHERVQRCMMLESNAFVEKLLKVVCLEGLDKSAVAQSMALDILVWVAAVRLNRHRSSKADVRTQQVEFARIIENHLNSLIKYCILLSGRSIAHKCVKLIIICSEGMKNATDSTTVPFDGCVLRSLLEWLPMISCVTSAGALRWYFLLLSRVMVLDVSATTGQKCLTLLQQVAKEMNNRSNSYHLLLRTRFGLYSTPFEAELFDIDPPVSAKPSSMPVTYATVVSNNNDMPGSVSVGVAGQGHTPLDPTVETLDLRELLANPASGSLVADIKGISARLKGLSSNHYMKGLLEVEPLHFTCHAASDGTKMEKMDPASLPPGVAAGGFDPSNFLVTNTGQKIQLPDGTDISDFKTIEVYKSDGYKKMVQSKSSTVIIELDKFDKASDASSSSSQQSTASGPAVFQCPIISTIIKKEEAKKVEPEVDSTLPWQQLLISQPQHMLVIERMHSGARRFVVLDFGSPILLTDLLIPSCSDLVSLSVDIWTEGEEVDGQRLVVASDIGTKSLIMSDLQPPPICRYLKITTIGRYGMSTTRCRIPIGSFFGHMVVLPGESYRHDVGISESGIETQLGVLSSLFEDIHCRYSLACAKLQDLLTPLLTEEIPNVVHMHHYLQRSSDAEKPFSTFPPSEPSQRIIPAFQECVTFQHQLNLVRNVMRRLEGAQGAVLELPSLRDTSVMLGDACTDKLRVLGESLLDILLYLTYEIGPVPRLPLSLYNMLDQHMCECLFEWLCIREDTRMQLSACTLLVRMCGLQPWWGDFLAHTLTTFYSSQHNSIFPQDRVFLLITYLGRKSLSGGASRTAVVDSVLATLARLLTPLATPRPTSFLIANMDLGLVGWILLFLSVCLDTMAGISAPDEGDKQGGSHSNKDGSASRWDFIQGEIALQKRMASTSRNSASRSYRRKLQKRLMHHKQQLEDLETAKKAFHASTQALSALSSQAANLTSKLEAALKQHEHVFKKTLKQHSSKHFKDILQIRRNEVPGLLNRQGQGGSSSRSHIHSRDRDEAQTMAETALLTLPSNHCLPVAKGLIALILQMDFTCNIDMFLLACKVVARIVGATRPAITLGELVSEDQLLHLVRLAVWNDQHKGSWGGPWASHAICSLLQDVLEGVRAYPAVPVEETAEEAPVTVLETVSESSDRVDASTNTTQDEDLELLVDEAGPSGSTRKSNSYHQLPSLLDSDDSELEDFLDDILERGRTLLKKGSNSSNRLVASVSSSISTAMDARLEYGVEASAEVTLKRLTSLGAYNLPLSVNAPITPTPEQARQPHNHMWDPALFAPWTSSDQTPPDSYQMLASVFDKVFTELHIHNSWTNLELVLQLWLILNVEFAMDPSHFGVFDPSISAVIALSPRAVSGLMAALAWHPGITLRAWSLAFQCLTVLANSPHDSTSSEDDVENSLKGMAKVMVNDPQFVPMLLRFLSGSGLNPGMCSAKGCAGPSVCQALQDLLVRLQMRCDVITITSKPGNALKEMLLKLVYQLVQPSGALANRQGPLDAQCKLVDMLLHLNFENIDLSTAMSILESVGVLVYTYILSLEKVKCRSVSENNISASSCFGGLFASVLGSEAKQGKPATWDALICSLLKLVNKLVQTPLQSVDNPDQQAAGKVADDQVEPYQSDMCQTDEHKAEQANSSEIPRSARPQMKVVCVADTVLQHHPTMLRLLSALAGCSGSTLAMMLGSDSKPEQLCLGEFGEPLSVGDAVFQLLVVLARKATSPQLILRPLFDFLSSSCNGQPAVGSIGVMQLSEPLLWFILRVVDTEQALQELNVMGGIRVICENLVKSNSALINGHPSLVSVVMQHLCHIPSSSGNNKKGGSPVETYEGLLNFAPLGTITSSSPSAQPADILIQSAPPHRRARTPAWSYHFYPDETWVDLTLTLPCAVLLKEVQLQPHLTSLATCPSAVALEVSRDASSGLVPVCPPLSTSGLTFIRLSLPQPEVVLSVLVRLYKPRDSSNIGLSQIRLLGSTTFGETSYRTTNMEVPDEEQLSKSSLGWLRLLHHCVCLPADGSELSALVLRSTAEVPQLLDACCGLLLIPAPSPALFAPSLERVLLKLGLSSRELGLQQMTTLLSNGGSSASVVELLYQLCITQDSATGDRVGTLLSWLGHMAQQQTFASPSYVHTSAAILWCAHQATVNYDLSVAITPELFSSLYNWTLALPVHSALKRAVDMVLCSMCYIKPTLFPMLLQRMGILVPNLSTHHGASISDDRKDQDIGHASITDDSKELVIERETTSDSAEWYNHLMIQDMHRLSLSEWNLMTLAVSCQSPPATQQLLDSGLPTLLTHAVVEFCQREQQASPGTMTDSDKVIGRERNGPSENLPMLKIETITTVLNFFAEVCSVGRMRDWLGSFEGSIFWLPLFRLLCNRRTPETEEHLPPCELASELYGALESATIKFLSRCCWCHPINQQLLARVLCDVVTQQKSVLHNVTFLHGISGFTRRLVLQLLLENERLSVFLEANFSLNNCGPVLSNGSLHHPSYGVGHQRQLLYLSTQTTCAEILKYVTIPGIITLGDQFKAGETNGDCKKELTEIGLGMVDQLYWAAGVTAKDKRTKDAKNAAAVGSRSTSYAKRSHQTTDASPTSAGYFSGLPMPQHTLHHTVCPNVALPGSLTLSQLLYLIEEQGESLRTPCISLSISQQPKNGSKEDPAKSVSEGTRLLSTPSLATPLQVFSQQGGLALLAQHLPLVYPETLRYSPHDKTGCCPAEALDAEWVKIEAEQDIYEDLDDSIPAGSSSPGGGTCRHPPSLPPAVPPHSLAAFGLFLRLPGYADVLLRDRKKAQCLLRLVLGVTDDGEGGDIFSLPIASSLHTLPFQVLRQLFDSTPLTTDDGVLLRRTTIDIGAISLLLGCLAVFTHQQQDANAQANVQAEVVANPNKSTGERGKSDDKSHLYWAKGTGFGTGSTTQSWNVEQALMRQRSEEEHVTVLLQVLSSYINPGGMAPPGFEDSDEDINPDNPLPPQFYDLLDQSCLLPAISSYLRNDSVLDMGRHIPLYRAVLQLLRAIAYNPQLVSLLLPPDKKGSARADDLSVVCLLTKMKNCVDTYASRLKLNKNKGSGKTRMPNKLQEELESDEGLALFIIDIQETANLCEVATDRLVLEDEENFPDEEIEFPLRRSLEERYLEVMKKLQFDSYEMITECPEGGYQFVVSYHFESNVRAAGDRCHPSRVKRLAQETVTLSTSLPLSYSSSVFVRCDVDRLDIMKVLITGPAETPYANGCFEFDVYFPPEYPNAPMLINLETTGHHTIRFNPNLYNDGKVCLSVLNTWHGRPEEKWNAHTSSFLQVLVSIQSLILVPEPYFNEPGYERSRGTPSGNQSSREYNSNICQATVKWAMLEQVRNPCPCFKEMIHTHFWMKRKEIVNQVEGWISDMESHSGDRRTGRTISLNAMALKRHFRQLREELAKLSTPDGLSDLIDPSFDVGLPTNSNTSNTPDSKDSKETSPTVSETSTLPFPVVSSPVANHLTDESMHHDLDIEMEKMVSKVCE